MSGHESELLGECPALCRAEKDALRKRRKILRALSPGRRFEIGMELNDLALELMKAGWRAHYPNGSETDMRAALRRRILPQPLRRKFEAALAARHGDPSGNRE